MPDDPPANPHFEVLDDWDAAETWMGFVPCIPRDTRGRALERLAVFVRDHRMREVGPEARALEAHYGTFVFSQSRPGADAARHAVVEARYGLAPRVDDVNGREARAYELGPEPPPDDIDPRMPAVAVWADGDRFFLVASDSLPLESVLAVARSVV